jgi:hypothetical protein
MIKRCLAFIVLLLWMVVLLPIMAHAQSWTDSRILSQIPVAYRVTAAETAASASVQSPQYAPGNVFRYMTAAQIADVIGGTHSTDDAAAFTTCLTVIQRCFVPAYTYRLASGITIPGGSSLQGEWMSAYNGPAGTILQCDLSVATCVTVQSSSGGNGLSYVAVTRAAGTIPASSVGVAVGGSNTYNPTLAYVFSQRHSIGFNFNVGITAMADHLFTGAISDAHMVQGDFPEVRILNSRFGQNGGGDISSCETFIRTTGGNASNPSGGPNTLILIGDQFNQSVVGCAHFREWVSKLGGAVNAIGEDVIDNIYVEGVTSSYFYSDSSWASITRLKVVNSSFNSSGAPPFFAFNSSTKVSDGIQFSNNQIASFATLAPPNGSQVMLSGNYVPAGWSITGGGNTTDVTMVGNYTGGNSVYAGTFRSLVSLDDISAGATLTDTSAATQKLVNNVGLINAPGNGHTFGQTTIAALAGSDALALNMSASSEDALDITDSFSGAGTAQQVAISAANNTAGATIKLTGNGATPTKYIRAQSGQLLVMSNSGTPILSLTDAGALTVANGVTVTAGTIAASGNGHTLGQTTFTAQSGGDGVAINQSLSNANSLDITDSFSGAGTAQQVSLTAANNTAGATIKITGNGATTPTKYIRVQGGSLFILNNGGTAALTLTDAGALTAANGLTATAGGLTVSAGGASITGATTHTGTLTLSGTDSFIQLNTNTVAHLGTTCTSGQTGQQYYVTDATAPTIGSTVAGSGAAKAQIWCNGANWTVTGK